MGLTDDLADSGGTDGGAASAVASGSQDNAGLDAAGTSTAGSKLDPDILEKLRSVDPRELPDDLRIKLEKPFLSEATKRNQTLSERERSLATREAKILDLAMGKLAEKGVDPTAQQKEALRQRIAEGDMAAVSDLVETLYTERVQPNLNAMQLRSIMEQTHRDFPILQDPEVAQRVQQTMSENPVLAEMARAGNFTGTAFVLRGLAVDAMLQRTAAELKSLKDGQAARDKAIADKAISDYKAKVMGLPTETSRAGTTPRGAASEAEVDFRTAFNQTWDEFHGG